MSRCAARSAWSGFGELTRERATLGPTAPSAEVLDELLRAFSADTDDAERLEQVDLESPAVQELLANPSAGPEA